VPAHLFRRDVIFLGIRAIFSVPNPAIRG